MRSRADSDFATPLRAGANSIALEIDGRVVSVPEGTSVIRAAAEAGVGLLAYTSAPYADFIFVTFATFCQAMHGRTTSIDPPRKPGISGG